jgi:hypothetical protein
MRKINALDVRMWPAGMKLEPVTNVGPGQADTCGKAVAPARAGNIIEFEPALVRRRYAQIVARTLA